jgi:hypothetical protein
VDNNNSKLSLIPFSRDSFLYPRLCRCTHNEIDPENGNAPIGNIIIPNPYRSL